MEKRLNEIKVRLTDSEWLAVSKLATIDDRTLGDYIHHIVALHLFGHEYKLNLDDVKGKQTIRD